MFSVNDTNVCDLTNLNLIAVSASHGTNEADSLKTAELAEGTAQLPEFGGIAELMQQELDLRKAIQGILVGLNWPHSAEIDRTLREQLLQLSTNIEVLNQRYMLPAKTGEHDQPTSPGYGAESPGVSEGTISLESLIAQYRTVLGTIGTLIMKGSDRERGKLILTQVARSHEEMASTLTTFLPRNPLHHDLEAVPKAIPTGSEARWENEGGPAEPAPEPVAAN